MLSQASSFLITTKEEKEYRTRATSDSCPGALFTPGSLLHVKISPLIPQGIEALAAEGGGPLAGGGGRITQVTVDQAGAVLGIE